MATVSLKAVLTVCKHVAWPKVVRIACTATTPDPALFAGHPKPA